MPQEPQRDGHHQEETQFFLSTGDLMAALLMIFILLLCATLLRLHNEYGKKAEMSDTYKEMFEEYQQLSETYQKLAETYKQLQDDLYQDMFVEFREDLGKWDAVIDRDTLSMRFREPDVLFSKGEDEVTDRFALILADFFPRYINLLSSPKYRESIEEVRIEGHTSSEWESGYEQDHAYFLNMELSQNRTRNVLSYCLNQMSEGAVRTWAKSRITANGLSSSRPITINGAESKEGSRRVEFRVRTDAEKRIAEILKLAEKRRALLKKLNAGTAPDG